MEQQGGVMDGGPEEAWQRPMQGSRRTAEWSEGDSNEKHSFISRGVAFLEGRVRS